jgi:hypothetical protein
MSANQGGVEIILSSGRSDRPSVLFAPGVATQPLAVGQTGDWRVFAEGVGPVHLQVGFDGTEAYVARPSQELAVYVGGHPIEPGWTRVTLPCEIRFGAACLVLRRATRSGAPAELPSTVYDGGATFEAARRAAQSSPELGRGGAGPGVGPAQEATADQAPSTLRMAHAGPGGLGPAPTPVPPSPAPRANERPSVAVAAAAAAASPAAAPPAAAGAAGIAAYWRSASPVKRITLALMPLALGAAYFMFQDAPPPARPRAPAAGSARALPASSPAVASVAPAPGPQASAPAAAPTPTAAAAPKPEADRPAVEAAASKAAPAPGKKTAEREAIDLAAAGSYDEAARRYDALASLHSEDPAYKEAARILRAKAGQGH